MNGAELREALDELRAARRYSEALTADLDEGQVMWRPHADSSAMAWHLGHQAAVALYLARNLTAARPRLDDRLEAVFDSATPERQRGELPSLAALVEFRASACEQVDETLLMIADGHVGAPAQLSVIAGGVLRALTNHEYQHARWMAEVRERFTALAVPVPMADRLELIDGYLVVADPPGRPAGR